MGVGCQRSRQRIVTLKIGFSPKDFFIWVVARVPLLVISLRPKVRNGVRVGKEIDSETPSGVGLQRESLCCREISPL